MCKLDHFFCSFGLTASFLATGTASATDLTGAGATFHYPIYAKWAEAYKAKSPNGTVC